MLENIKAPKGKFTVIGVSVINGAKEFFADFYSLYRTEQYVKNIGNDVIICHVFNDVGKHMGRTYCMSSKGKTTFGPR